ncbi:MAG: zinc metallopeptidase [Bacilli bacterium]|jgi:Zn-dependent membrane protease YugP
MYLTYETPATMILLIIGIVITLGAQILVTQAYNKYKRIGNNKGITGFEAARKILDKNGLDNIHVVEVKSILGDHYDPVRKAIRLSTEVFHGDSIASVSIAAHEASHAVQHQQGYLFMRVRSTIMPLVSFGSKLGYVAIIIGFILSLYDLVTLGIWLLMSIIIFELVTLPVEYNASAKAKVELIDTGVLTADEVIKANNMLGAAALTYVAAVATSLLQIMRLILIYGRRRD